jgi:dihydrofolate reductase
MARVVAVEHLTLDGVMQGPARPDEDRRDGFAYGGWAAANSDPAMQAAIGAHMKDGWSLLLGRISYEDLHGFWPKQPEPNPFTAALNNAEKFVASTTLAEPLPWQNSTLLRGDAADAVATLKREHAKTLVIFGSGMLVRSLMRRGLVDDFVLMIHPLVLGTGRRLFTEEAPLSTLTLVDSAITAKGVFIGTYRSAPAQ